MHALTYLSIHLSVYLSIYIYSNDYLGLRFGDFRFFLCSCRGQNFGGGEVAVSLSLSLYIYTHVCIDLLISIYI